MGKGFEETFLQRRHANGRQVRDWVVNLTNPQGSASQNNNETLPYTC